MSETPTDLAPAATSLEPLPAATRGRAEVDQLRDQIATITAERDRLRDQVAHLVADVEAARKTLDKLEKLGDLVDRIEPIAAPTIRRRFPVAADVLTELAQLGG